MIANGDTCGRSARDHKVLLMIFLKLFLGISQTGSRKWIDGATK
jgi:hypothetical protein